MKLGAAWQKVKEGLLPGVRLGRERAEQEFARRQAQRKEAEELAFNIARARQSEAARVAALVRARARGYRGRHRGEMIPGMMSRLGKLPL